MSAQPLIIPLWVKLAYTVMVAVIVPVYWVQHGPANFLWISDVALLALLLALWLDLRLLASMMAVGALPFEIAWVIDFFLGGPLQIAHYMFFDDMPLYLRGLSLFHLVLPPVLIALLLRLGYDRRALLWQTVLLWLLLPLTWLVTDPAESNINWVYGFGAPQDIMHPLAYLALLMIIIPVAVHLPMHLVLCKIKRLKHSP